MQKIFNAMSKPPLHLQLKIITQEQEKQQDLELQQAIEAELAEQQNSEDIVLKSNASEDSETDGVKITPLPANTDAPYEASIEKTP